MHSRKTQSAFSNCGRIWLSAAFSVVTAISLSGCEGCTGVGVGSDAGSSGSVDGGFTAVDNGDGGNGQDDGGISTGDDGGNSAGDDGGFANEADGGGGADAGSDGGMAAGCTTVGDPCDDGFFCLVGESCQADGTCGGGTVRDCSSAAVDPQCSVGLCNENSESCFAVARNLNDPCDDGNTCTLGEVCQNNGTCSQGAAVSCGYLVTDDQCQSAACVQAQGGCVLSNINEDQVCDDGAFCTDTTCSSGSCTGASTGQVCGVSNELCCAMSTVCINDNCILPGLVCVDTEDCNLGEICDPVLGLCIDRNFVEACEYVPPVGVLDPIIGCRWSPPTGTANPTPGRDNVVMNPVVADVTKDGYPEIMFVAWDRAWGTCCDEPATLYVTRGTCNIETGNLPTLASVRAENPNGGFYDLDESGGLTVGDLDGDGVPEIVAMLLTQGTIAFKRAADDGTAWNVYWVNAAYPIRGTHTNGGTQPSMADFKADGLPEIVVGNVALNGQDGTLLWDGLTSNPGNGSSRGIGNNAFLGPVSHVADIDLDGEPEIIAGNTAYDTDGNVEWTYNFTSNFGECQGPLACDGYTATGNFDDDDFGEVVIVRQGEIHVVSHLGVLEMMDNPSGGTMMDMKVQIPWDDCTGNVVKNESGPPTVADFDGDGRPEIGTAGADFYAVIDFDCVGTPLPAECDSQFVLWKTPNKDCSSRATASSVFDFEGDGAAEVIYADESNFYIMDGKTGTVLYLDATHGSNTRLEMPVIADVDNDGSAEIIIPENENVGGIAGVEIWDDANANWVRTRKIWNQHSYHVSNVNDDGTIPLYETPNWLDPRLNNFRQNVQPDGLFDASDLVVENITAICTGDGNIVVTACIGNEGAISVPAGLVNSGKVILANGAEVDLGQATTVDPLVPGICVNVEFVIAQPIKVQNEESFSIQVTADDDGSANGAFNECDESNNTLRVDGFGC
ncbi:MAG: hypothetical protein GY822_28790 [Deltaproteobacteria bacterium]|nr:hypothetical protein [Deltaproteobacteria bacterium]